jgi:hypothetical protein
MRGWVASRCGRLLVVLGPLVEAPSLQRLWVLFEIALAEEEHVEVVGHHHHSNE